MVRIKAILKKIMAMRTVLATTTNGIHTAKPISSKALNTITFYPSSLIPVKPPHKEQHNKAK